MKLKNISQQTIVITGATSGIGLTTARMAAEKGAKLVLIARNEDALRELVNEINSGGGSAVYSAADVADENALREAANLAEREFGGFDTWVNNAGGSIYGRIMDIPTEDMRRLFETNFWGVVNGSRVAVEHLRRRGGALINIGSEVSDSPIPLQGVYSASKHAVKGFTDSLRIELEADRLPISVTIIKPTAINTPFAEHAKNYLPYEPELPQPLYAPELVAEAIIHCAEYPEREFFVGGMAKARSTMSKFMPGTGEKLNEMMIDTMQNSGEPARGFRQDSLYETHSALRERGDENRFTLERSVYQRASMHPLLTGALAVGGGLAVAALLASRWSKGEAEHGRSFRMGGSNVHSFDIHEKMTVAGADGQNVGTVDHVEYGEIKLTRKDSPDGMHHYISTDLVDTIKGNRVILSRSAEDVRRIWKTDSTETGGKRYTDDASSNLSSRASKNRGDIL